MSIKLILGIVLFVIGLATAVVGIAGVAGPDSAAEEGSMATGGNLSDNLEDSNAGSYAIPIVAALSLAIGGLLIGVSFGNWKHPRTHLEPGDEVVNPEGYHKMKHV